MSKTMEHWNGNQVCVVDTETTGLDPHWHEIIQICILPLDSNFVPRTDIVPFYVNLKPANPERADPAALKANKIRLSEIAISGHDKEKAKDLLATWIQKLGLSTTKWGTSKRIIPLGQNYPFDKGFIQAWLGIEEYDQIFDHRHRDTMTVGLYLNDRAGMHGESVPFPKVNLKYLCSQLKISHEHGHDSLQDCIVTAKAYRQMVAQGLLG